MDKGLFRKNSFNRLFQSQTDLFGTKILTPQFFLENILPLCPKVGGSENFPPSDPPGLPGPLFRGQTPQNREIAYVARKNFLLLADLVGHSKPFTQFQKKWIRPFFGLF